MSRRTRLGVGLFAGGGEKGDDENRRDDDCAENQHPRPKLDEDADTYQGAQHGQRVGGTARAGYVD
ncbi:TPA: hypothetical protein KE432_001900 [Corynebacterium striatum]|nr:hypothetical protein [Corynebacterium striatum]